MTPEQQARQLIDQQLTRCGWLVQDYRRMNLSAGRGLAIREFPLRTGAADYLLYVDSKAIGVVEAKPEGHPLRGVETQSDKYLAGLPAGLPHYRLPLPFAYESTGTVTQFTNVLEADARSREVFAFHRPEELLRLVQLDQQTRSLLKQMPPLDVGRLWHVQESAIRNLETSLADNRPRSLIQMATGSGKTFTAVSACYRLIKFAKARRILFLVDRNNLGRQTLNEFQQYVSPNTGRKFTDEYSVQHLKRNTIDPASKVCITTIQRLFSMLKGDEEYDEENEEGSLFETDTPLFRQPMPVEYNPKVPIETFDFIVVDECHRSIYNLWRQVLDYPDAFIIGLTATPTAQTIGFFNNNLVQDYTHEQAVADGVNVGYDVYRIETAISRDGARLLKEPGIFVPHRDRRTKRRRYQELDDDVLYLANQLDRDVVAEDQIRLVIKTFKERLPQIFPGRTEVPKTLVFAKTDLHAEDIVRIIREEFGKGNEFCVKITSKTTGRKPEDLLAEFRTMYNPRIAVTVDMIATGTDVKPLECLLFMRNIRSMSYFEQMKGRGCRVVDPHTLQSVTPDARAKTMFIIVDAVGVCESEKSCSRPLDCKPQVSLEKVLTLVAAGAASDEIVSSLAAKLARLNRQLDHHEQDVIAREAGGSDLSLLCSSLLTSIDADAIAEQAKTRFGQEPTEKQLEAVEQERIRGALAPFYNPRLRDAIIGSKQALEQVIDETTRDRLLRAEFDPAALDRARSLVSDFKKFVEDHKDDIEALRVLYSRPYRAGLRFNQLKDLAAEIQRPPNRLNPDQVWRAFQAVEPEKVRGSCQHLTDVVALVRHAIEPASLLMPYSEAVEERYQRWLADQAAAGASFTPEQRKWLDAIKDHIAKCLSIEQDDFEDVPFNQIGGLSRAHEVFGDRLTALLDELNARLAA